MPAPSRHALPYSQDSSTIFARLQHLPGAVYLDSAHPHSRQGRFDILAAQPVITFTPTDEIDLAGLVADLHDQLSSLSTLADLPFCGGAIGYLGYHLGEQLQLAAPPTQITAMPEYLIGIYHWAVVFDHQRHSAWLVTQASVPSQQTAALLTLLTTDTEPVRTCFSLPNGMPCQDSDDHYRRAFAASQEYILAGDCYQVNLSRSFAGEFVGDAWPAYLALRNRAAAPFSVYFNTPAGQLLSVSPERLLSAAEQRITSQPIKGTAPRDPDPAVDQDLAAALQTSEKNRAENLMIVDLLRNDLGKSCIAGSVQVDALWQLQSFNTVHHLVSTVSGTLRGDVDPLSALLAAFPGGSITGAPKQRAMEIIAELEEESRGLYCGSVFYLGPDGHMDSNILIRSFVCEQGRISARAGGGIVADSVQEDELNETDTKITALINALKDAAETTD